MLPVSMHHHHHGHSHGHPSGVPTGHPGDAFLQDMAQQLQTTFGIHQTTLQIEVGDTDSPCVLESDKHF